MPRRLAWACEATKTSMRRRVTAMQSIFDNAPADAFDVDASSEWEMIGSYGATYSGACAAGSDAVTVSST